MVLATVPEALPTWKNQRATSWPAPISAKVPYFLASRLICNAFWPVFNFSSLIISLRAARYRKNSRVSNASVSAFRAAGLGYTVPMYRTQDLHVKTIVPLSSPGSLKAQTPTTEAANATVARSRERIIRIWRQEDPGLLVVIGPCSIHDEKSALEYATKLNALRKEFADRMEIVMRVYFEKPRTTIGWEGLINDPHLDGSQDIETGLKIARKLLLEITGMGLPAATEFLDPIVPQYIADLIAWAAIGARTTESQTHREMASGLSMPVGFKNGTDGSLQVAMDAMHAAMRPHSFLGIDQNGATAIVRTAGNPPPHVGLPGGRPQTQYHAESIL